MSTPMMQQYLAIKKVHPDCFLFFRLGDFYELFFKDAILASKILDIVLTKRGKDEQGDDIAMCGVPVQSYEYYLEKLVKQGHKVAICEQMESPEEAKKRGTSAIVRREVVRIVTPGTILEEGILDPINSNYLCAICIYKEEVSIASIDISTGKFFYITVGIAALEHEIARLDPSEIIVSDKFFEQAQYRELIKDFEAKITTRSHITFSYNRAIAKLKKIFNYNIEHDLAAWNNAEVIAVGVLLEYLEHTQKSFLPQIDLPKSLTMNEFVSIDKNTFTNLEVFPATNIKNSLFKLLNSTKTSMGGRLLRNYLSMPLKSPEAIEARLDTVEFFSSHKQFSSAISSLLANFPDMERLLAKLRFNKATIKDLLKLKQGFEVIILIINEYYQYNLSVPKLLYTQILALNNFDKEYGVLKSALREEAITENSSTQFINYGFCLELDNYYNLLQNVQTQITEMRDKYRAQTGINNLKIESNNMIGYYIEVTASNSNKIPKEIFKPRQSLTSCVRFTTDELNKLSENIASCNDKIKSLETQIFNDLCQELLKSSEKILLSSQAIAIMDLAISFAANAEKYGYTRPKVNNSERIVIENGRHPVIETKLREEFVQNNLYMDKNCNTWLITGPNMAGKSTFLRQSALIILMAQIGSFVPADNSEIGVVDKIFSRVGASDDITKGLSTFMMEMTEAAAILNNASSRSFLIIDEIGRGTATYDGLSIAWSILEYIHNEIKARTLFATHYLELAELEETLPRMQCYTPEIIEWSDKVIFKHRMIKGRAKRSYGIHVASMAGLPKTVLNRAKELLLNFETQNSALNNNEKIDNTQDEAQVLLHMQQAT